MDWLIQRPIAHRGLHKGSYIPENSYQAFQEAILNNYAIELDVRITKDKKVVIFHDKNTLRMCGVKRRIDNQNYADLEQFTLNNTQQKIPLLKEVLELVDNQVPLFIEIKNYGQVGEFEKLVLEELKSYSGKYAICSFNVEVVKWFRQNHPEIIRGLVYCDLHKFGINFFHLVFLYRLLLVRPDFIFLDYKLLDTFLPKMVRLFKKPLICWTVNGKKKLAKAQTIVDCVIFENVKPIKKDRT